MEPMEIVVIQQALPQIGGGTKKDIEDAALQIVEATLEAGNPLEVAEKISATEALIKKIKENNRFTDYVRTEVAKHGKQFTSSSGAKLECCETSVSYDFSNDTIWVGLNERLEILKAKIKAREEMLKKIPAGKMLVDEETGEALVGPTRSSKDSYKITLAK